MQTLVLFTGDNSFNWQIWLRVCNLLHLLQRKMIKANMLELIKWPDLNDSWPSTPPSSGQASKEDQQQEKKHSPHRSLRHHRRCNVCWCPRGERSWEKGSPRPSPSSRGVFRRVWPGQEAQQGVQAERGRGCHRDKSGSGHHHQVCSMTQAFFKRSLFSLPKWRWPLLPQDDLQDSLKIVWKVYFQSFRK